MTATFFLYKVIQLAATFSDENLLKLYTHVTSASVQQTHRNLRLQPPDYSKIAPHLRFRTVSKLDLITEC